MAWSAPGRKGAHRPVGARMAVDPLRSNCPVDDGRAQDLAHGKAAERRDRECSV